MLGTHTPITLRRRQHRLMITVGYTILTDKDILHTTHQEVLLLAIQQFQRILKTNESGNIRTIKDVHALSAHHDTCFDLALECFHIG